MEVGVGRRRRETERGTGSVGDFKQIQSRPATVPHPNIGYYLELFWVITTRGGGGATGV